MDCVLVNNWCCSSHGRSTIDYFDSCGFDSFVYWWWVVNMPTDNPVLFSDLGDSEKTSSLIELVKRSSNKPVGLSGSCMVHLELGGH